jgi:hypothetical protein
MQCRLSWGDLGVDCADSYMPVLLGNYLLFALLGFLSCGRAYRDYPVMALRFVLLRLVMPDLVWGCCPRSVTAHDRGVQIAFHPTVK